MFSEAFSFDFFVRALVAVILICPLLSMLGTMVVQRKMSFFSDALGHSAFTGVAIGVLLGVNNLNLAMILFAIVFAVLLNALMRKNSAITDTVISVFSSFCIAIGLAILSFGGSFSKYSSLLVGDVLSITTKELWSVVIVAVLATFFWCIFINGLAAASLNRPLAKSKGLNVDLLELIFSILVAVIVMIAVKWIGILLINALMILPSAASRNISENMREYHGFATLFAFVSGVLGLFLSFFVGIATGPAIVIFASVIYFATYFLGSKGTK